MGVGPTHISVAAWCHCRLPSGVTPTSAGLNFTAVTYRERVQTPSRLFAVAPWAVDTLVVAGSAASIRLQVDWPLTGDAIPADGQSVVLVTATVVDLAGRLVRAAHMLGHELRFSVSSGDAHVIGTGNGDPSDDFNATGAVRRAWAGCARAIVRVGAAPGAVLVEASSAGLQTGSVKFHTVSVIGGGAVAATGKVSTPLSSSLLLAGS